MSWFNNFAGQWFGAWFGATGEPVQQQQPAGHALEHGGRIRYFKDEDEARCWLLSLKHAFVAPLKTRPRPASGRERPQVDASGRERTELPAKAPNELAFQPVRVHSAPRAVWRAVARLNKAMLAQVKRTAKQDDDEEMLMILMWLN